MLARLTRLPHQRQVRVQLAEAEELGDTAGASTWSGGADAERCTIPHLAAGAEYVCQVRAASAEGSGAWSVPLCCRTALGPPATPAPPVVVAKTSTTVHTHSAHSSQSPDSSPDSNPHNPHNPHDPHDPHNPHPAPHPHPHLHPDLHRCTSGGAARAAAARRSYGSWRWTAARGATLTPKVSSRMMATGRAWAWVWGLGLAR